LSRSILARNTVQVSHLARLLRWHRYREETATDGATPLRFDVTWCVEPLTTEHHDHLVSISTEVTDLELVDPPPGPALLRSA
jgi:hypothetical protein